MSARHNVIDVPILNVVPVQQRRETTVGTRADDQHAEVDDARRRHRSAKLARDKACARYLTEGTPEALDEWLAAKGEHVDARYRLKAAQAIERVAGASS